MKKIKNIILAIIFTSTLFVACEKEKNSHTIVGSWKLVEVREKMDGKYICIDFSPETLEITPTTLTTHNIDYVFNNVQMEYEFKDNWIWLFGMECFEVTYNTENILQFRSAYETPYGNGDNLYMYTSTNYKITPSDLAGTWDVVEVWAESNGTIKEVNDGVIIGNGDIFNPGTFEFTKKTMARYKKGEEKNGIEYKIQGNDIICGETTYTVNYNTDNTLSITEIDPLNFGASLSFNLIYIAKKR